MEKLGWNNAFFPPLGSDDYPNWNELMVSSSELDDNGSCLSISGEKDLSLVLS